MVSNQTQMEGSIIDVGVSDTAAAQAQVQVQAQFDATYIVNTYGDMLYKLAVSQLNNKSDALDAVQDVLLKIHIKNPSWRTQEHLKAWVIRAVINRCRDYNRKRQTQNAVELHEVYGVSQDSEHYELGQALANLPQKYRVTLYLHYYEGYKINEIAKLLKVGESGIKKRLVKGREMLKDLLKGE